MANDNWQEEGSTLEFRNQKWENQSSNALWNWIICPRCNRTTDHAKEESVLITPYSFYCPYCGKELKLNIKVKDSIKYSFHAVTNIKGEKDVY